jgi:hypothetical protein
MFVVHLIPLVVMSFIIPLFAGLLFLSLQVCSSLCRFIQLLYSLPLVGASKRLRQAEERRFPSEGRDNLITENMDG